MLRFLVLGMILTWNITNYSKQIDKLVVSLMKGLAEELSRDGACEKAIFPDTNIVVDRCAMIGNLTVEGVSRSSTLSLSPIYNSFSFRNAVKIKL